MERPSKRQLFVPLLVLTLLLAGCTGDGGDADVPTADAEPTTTPADPDADDAADTTTPDSATPVANGGASGFSPNSHSTALSQAGSYTIEFTMAGVGSGAAGPQAGGFSGTQKVDVDTNQQHTTLESSAGGQSYTIEYYQPPNAETAYQNMQGQVDEITPSQASFFDVSNPGTGATVDAWPEFPAAGTGSTELGPANKYVIDSIADLPSATTSTYDDIQDVTFTVWEDADTGIIAKYDYSLTHVGEEGEQTVTMSFELTDLGSTTIQEPGWVP